MSPMAIELALAIWEEIRQRQHETDRLRRQHVERAQYEADLARRRYMQVDPSNRLVANSLEAEWNNKLRALSDAQEQYEQHKRADEATGRQIDRDRVFSLVKDFPAIWKDPNTPQRERKRMVALLIEDVTLTKAESIVVNVRFRGGATTTLELPLPLNAWQGRMTPKATVQLIDDLLEEHTDAQVATILNERGVLSGAGAPFSSDAVRWVRNSAGLKSLKQRLREKGWLTTDEYAAKLGVHYQSVRSWRKRGILRARPCNERGQWLFEPNQNDPRAIKSKHGV
jgi:hypothetical protein